MTKDSTSPMPIHGFTHISNNVFYYESQATSGGSCGASTLQAEHPTTVMIFGWADANPRNLSKYTETYSQLYTSSSIILVTSSSFTALTSSSKDRRQMCLPAARLLLSQHSGGQHDKSQSARQPPEEKILLHAFSNGGMLNLIATIEAYQTLTANKAPFPHSLLILDSTPGGHLLSTELHRLSRVVAAGLKSTLPLPGFLASALSLLLVVCVVGIPTLLGFENSASLGRRELNNPELFAIGSDRLYIYSKADELIGWENVERHAVEAEDRGWYVHLKDFQDSPHCQHMRVHPEQYWSVVEKSWKTVVLSWLGNNKVDRTIRKCSL
jgi:Eukaryotic protein of unknown function (DUF829)